MTKEEIQLLEITSNIVVAYLQQANVTLEKIPEIIKSVTGALKQSIDDKSSDIFLSYKNAYHAPAVPIEDSVSDDYIICLEDGKKLKMLKRHLRTSFNMSVDDYLKKWGLPRNYPTVAPNYKIQRQELARCNGFGISIKGVNKVKFAKAAAINSSGEL